MSGQSIKFNWLDHIHGNSGPPGYNFNPYVDFVQSKNGNLISVGSFHGNIDFDPSLNAFNLNTIGNYNDSYVLSIDSSGNFLWADQITGSLHEYIKCVTTDDSNNIIVSGNYQYGGYIDFDPGIDTLSLIPYNSSDIFIEKLNSNGDLLWAFSIGGPGDESTNGIAADNNGNIYITGWITDSMDFDPGPAIQILNPIGSGNCFIAKYNKNGQFVWVKSILGPGNVLGSKIILDQNGFVYTLGNIATTGLIDFNTDFPDTLFYTGSGSFLHKMDSMGNFIWAKVINYPYSNSFNASICMDISGNIYISDEFHGTGDFDPGSAQYIVSTTFTFYSDAFILKLDPLGEFVWFKHLKGNGMSSSKIYDISSDNLDGVYACGLYSGTCDMDVGTNSSILIDTTGQNAYILKIDTNNNFKWVKEYEGTFTHPKKIIADGMKNVYLFGLWGDTTDFNPGLNDSLLISIGFEDLFIQKLNNCLQSFKSDSIFSCGTFQWINGNTYTSDNSSDYYILENSCGCDSVIKLNLDINIVNTDSVFIIDSLLYTTYSNATFQWLNCDNNYSILPGQNSSSIIADSLINYAVEITQNGCVDTSECFHINLVSVFDLNSSLFTIFPNPGNEYVYLDFAENNHSNLNIELYSIDGKIIQSQILNSPKSMVFVSLTNISSGSYFVKVSANNEIIGTKKLVVVK